MTMSHINIILNECISFVAFIKLHELILVYRKIEL